MNNATSDEIIIEFLFAALKERHLTHLNEICATFFKDKFGLDICIYLTGSIAGDHKLRKKYVLFSFADIFEISSVLEENNVLIEFFEKNNQTLSLERTKDEVLKGALAELSFDIAVPLNNENDKGSLPELVGILFGKINNSSLSRLLIPELCIYITKHLAAAFANAIYFHLNNKLIEQQKNAIFELKSKTDY